MKKYMSLIVGAILTIAAFASPLVFLLFEPLDMGIVFIIAFALIAIALLLGCFSRHLIKLVYPFEAVILFLLAGITIYRDVFDWRMGKDYGILILIITLVSIFIGSITRQLIVAIIKGIQKLKNK